MKIWCYGVLAFYLLLMTSLARAAESAPVQSGRITAQLVTSHDVVAPAQDLQIALSLRMEPKWHTYWRNAGGPGHPASIMWDKPDGINIGAMTWSLPILVYTGPLVSYVFEDQVLLPMPMSIPKDAKDGDILNITAYAGYLVCHTHCLSESADLHLTLQVGEPRIDNRWNANINRTLAHAPKPAPDTKAAATLKNGKLHISVLGDYKNPYFFPYEQDLINADHKPEITNGDKGVSLALTPGFLLEAGLSEPVKGVLAFDQNGKRAGIEITAFPDTQINIAPKSGSMKTILWLWAVFFGVLLIGFGFYLLRRKSAN